MRTPATLRLYTQPTELRRSYDGLAAMVHHELDRNPLNGQGFVFINRRPTQLKCLYFEAGNYCIWAKRLERGRTGSQPESSAIRSVNRGVGLEDQKRRKLL